MKSFLNLVFVYLILFWAIAGAQELCRIYIWDNAGDLASFPSPDPGDTRTVRSAQMIYEAITRIGRLGLPLNDVLEIVGPSTYPPPFGVAPAPNMIFITFGWRGSGSTVLDPDMIDRLVDYIDSSYADDVHALYLEGNDIGWDYGDTSSVHFSYSGIFMRLGGILRADALIPTGILRGTAGSLASGLEIRYNTTAVGPTTSMDDIVIGPAGSPFASQAYYVFDAGKSPARGMQRHSYPGSKRGPVYGAMVAFTFSFGNIVNDPTTDYRTILIHRVIDFLKPPVCDILAPAPGETLRGGNIYGIVYKAYDNCGLRPDSKIRFSSDGGLFWHNIFYVRDVTPGTATYYWSVPEITTDAAYLLLECWDNTDNYASKIIGPFRIIVGTSVELESVMPNQTQITRIFPNPFNEKAIVEISVGRRAVFDIYVVDISGRLQRRLFYGELADKKAKFSISSEGMSTGVYYLVCDSDVSRISSPFVIIK